MAAGLTIRKDAFDEFKELFACAVKELSDPEMFERNIVTDGELRASDFNTELVEAIRKHVWGQAFPEPLFANQFKVLSQRVLKDQHLKLSIWFRHKRELPPTVRLAYKLDINDFRGRQSVQLIIEGMEDEFEDWTA